MYASKQDMIDAYTEEALIELTDRDNLHEIDDDVLNRALADASAITDSYVSRRYNTTQARGTDVLRLHVCAIAYYKLHQGNYPDQIRVAYDDAMEFLRAISQGLANLDLDGVQPPSSPADARVEAPDRIFSRNSLKGL